ncbi:beta-1,4-mannosyltransferase [Coprinopsis sp. MPI-PUGE-AT-0042]|nr:beta-1,4-mannosyltransferase [Coprinopsis sp. MPI-PUGE-AT-0042]
MYHAQSFAENGFVTELVGYGGSDVIPALERLPRVKIRHLPEPPAFLRKLPFILFAPFKIVQQFVAIFFILLVIIEKPPEFLLVQNPPSIPTLLIVQLVARIRGSKVIIDWHNLGYSILALRLGDEHLFVRIYKWFERTFGRSAFAHLFVTRAMRDRLVHEWDLQGQKIVLHDRPPRHFHRASPQETHGLFQRLRPHLIANRPLHGFLPKYDPPYSTPFTQISTSHQSQSPGLPVTSAFQANRAGLTSATGAPGGVPNYIDISSPTMREDRPALLVSSTSWTDDEDFSILLEALGKYEARAKELNAEGKEAKLPKVLAIVTGKGPLKAKYMKDVAALQQSWNWVRCISLWLEAEDYPLLLGSADLGVSLHSSSSKLDLPMKVVDMFGCGLPVCALGFECLPELVKHGKNGLIFTNASELAEQLENLFFGFPKAQKLSSLTESLASAAQRPSTPGNIHMSRLHTPPNEDATWSTWEDNWNQIMRPLILSDVNL